MAEPDNEDDLPIATPIPPPLPAEPIGPPRAEPVKPIRKTLADEPKPRRRDPSPATREPDHSPPRARTFMACGVLGCLGLSLLGAVGFVAFAVVMLVGYLGNEIAERTGDPPTQAKGAGAARPGPIQPTKLTADATLQLDGPVLAVGRGANGRFLLLRVQNQILVFDPNEGQFLAPFQFDTNDTDLVFAASASKLFVYRQKRLERYSLMTREQPERTIPLAERPDALAIGADSDGPLFTFTTRQQFKKITTTIAEFDADSLATQGGIKTLTGFRIGRAGPRISADGRTIGVGPDDTNTGQFSFSGTRGLELRQIVGNLPGHIAPSPDGQWLYTSRGVFKPDGKPFIQPENTHLYTLPAAHGNDFYLSLETGGISGTIRDVLTLHLSGSADTEAFVKIDGIKGLAGLSADDLPTDKVAADQRVHFWPAAGLIAVIPATPDRTVQLYKVNVASLLPRIQEKYLVIGSDPPTVAVRGEEWQYGFTTWSSSRNVKYEVVNGPVGMNVKANADRTYRLVWKVPTTYEPHEQFVVLQASDGSLTTEHKFRLIIADPNNP